MVGVLMDYDYTFFGDEVQTAMIIFMTCHCLGITSTIINPIVYGYWDEDIQKGIFDKL